MEHRMQFPAQPFYILHPRYIWQLWDVIQANNLENIQPNPPSSGFIGKRHTHSVLLVQNPKVQFQWQTMTSTIATVMTVFKPFSQSQPKPLPIFEVKLSVVQSQADSSNKPLFLGGGYTEIAHFSLRFLKKMVVLLGICAQRQHECFICLSIVTSVIEWVLQLMPVMTRLADNSRH